MKELTVLMKSTIKKYLPKIKFTIFPIVNKYLNTKIQHLFILYIWSILSIKKQNYSINTLAAWKINTALKTICKVNILCPGLQKTAAKYLGRLGFFKMNPFVYVLQHACLLGWFQLKKARVIWIDI